jgi:hypothetical protein
MLRQALSGRDADESPRQNYQKGDKADDQWI